MFLEDEEKTHGEREENKGKMRARLRVTLQAGEGQDCQQQQKPGEGPWGFLLPKELALLTP